MPSRKPGYSAKDFKGRPTPRCDILEDGCVLKPQMFTLKVCTDPMQLIPFFKLGDRVGGD